MFNKDRKEIDLKKKKRRNSLNFFIRYFEFNIFQSSNVEELSADERAEMFSYIVFSF